MDPSYASEKSGREGHPPVYQEDVGYPPVQGVAPPYAGYSSGQCFSATPYGAQPYGAQPHGAQPYGAQAYGAQSVGAQSVGAQSVGIQSVETQSVEAQSYSGQTQYPGQAGITNQPSMFVSSTSTHMNPVPDYMFFSIFTMLCCCFPLGIAALVFSVSTRDANMTGNRDLALQNSSMSRLLNYIALGIGICVLLIWVISVIIYFTMYWV